MMPSKYCQDWKYIVKIAQCQNKNTKNLKKVYKLTFNNFLFHDDNFSDNNISKKTPNLKYPNTFFEDDNFHSYSCWCFEGARRPVVTAGY